MLGSNMTPQGGKRGWSPVPEATNPEPWYRHFWPWVLIGLPLAAVLAGITTLFLAMDEPDPLVVGDYYKQGLAINRILAREDAARSLGLKGSVRFEVATGDVLVILEGHGGGDLDTLRLKLIHATRDKYDLQVTLHPLGEGRYGGTLQAPLNPGGWIAHLEPADEAWRISGRAHVTTDTVAEITTELAP